MTSLLTNSMLIYEGPDLNLLPVPKVVPDQPRRHRFSFPINVLRDKFFWYHVGSSRSMDWATINDLEEIALDEAYRLTDLSKAYRIEIWTLPYVNVYCIQFLLADL